MEHSIIKSKSEKYWKMSKIKKYDFNIKANSVEVLSHQFIVLISSLIVFFLVCILHVYLVKRLAKFCFLGTARKE